MLNKTLDITVIILTYNEEIHIRRCLENVTPLPRRYLWLTRLQLTGQ